MRNQEFVDDFNVRAQEVTKFISSKLKTFAEELKKPETSREILELCDKYLTGTMSADEELNTKATVISKTGLSIDMFLHMARCVELTMDDEDIQPIDEYYLYLFNEPVLSHRQIVQYSKKGDRLLKIHSSLNAASRATGIKKQNISSACKGKTKTAGGFIWRYGLSRSFMTK